MATKTTKAAPSARTVQRDNKSMMEKDLVSCFRLHDVLYVPHYSEQGFVGPGYGQKHFIQYTADALAAAGAQREVCLLWNRPQHKR